MIVTRNEKGERGEAIPGAVHRGREAFVGVKANAKGYLRHTCRIDLDLSCDPGPWRRT